MLSASALKISDLLTVLIRLVGVIGLQYYICFIFWGTGSLIEMFNIRNHEKDRG